MVPAPHALRRCVRRPSASTWRLVAGFSFSTGRLSTRARVVCVCVCRYVRARVCVGPRRVPPLDPRAVQAIRGRRERLIAERSADDFLHLLEHRERLRVRKRAPGRGSTAHALAQTNETDEASSCPKQDMYVFLQSRAKPCICVTFRIMGQPRLEPGGEEIAIEPDDPRQMAIGIVPKMNASTSAHHSVPRGFAMPARPQGTEL